MTREISNGRNLSLHERICKNRVALPPFFLPCDQGESLKRLHRPNRFRFGCMRLMARVRFNVIADLEPVYPQRGPYEASEGIRADRGRKLARFLEGCSPIDNYSALEKETKRDLTRR